MSIWKRAITYLKGNIRRTIILLCIFTIVSAALIISLSIYDGSQKGMKELKESYGGSFSITTVESEAYVDYVFDEVTKRHVAVYNGEVVTDEIVDEISELDNITDVSKEKILYRSYFEDLNFIPGILTSELEYERENPGEYEEWFNLEILVKENKLWGYNESKLSSNFRTNTFELVEGKHITEADEGKILISDTLAELNRLKIGDCINAKITGYQVGFGDAEQIVVSKELEIVGIYHVNTVQRISEFTAETDIAGNYIICDLKTVQEMERLRNEASDMANDLRYNEVVFFADNPENLSQVMEDVKSLKTINWEFFEIQEDDDKYQDAMIPLKYIDRVILAMVIFTLIVCVVLLCLILQTWINTRKREVGILISVGNKMRSITLQFFVEGFLILCVASILATGLSMSLSNELGNRLLSQMNAIQERTEEMARKNAADPMFAGAGIEELQKYNEEVKIDAKAEAPNALVCEVTFQNAALCIVILMVVLMFSVWWAMKKTIRMKPKEILSSL